MKEGNNSSGALVRVIKIVNRLKGKIGILDNDETEGHLPEKAIKEADILIEKLCEECPAAMGGYIEQVGEKWKDMRDMPDSPERHAIGAEIYTIAHEIKDISSMCGFEFIAYFSESLRDYIERTELTMEAQRVIIQAHYDALVVVYKQGIKDEDNPLANELKQVVKIAIDKYS